MASPNKYSPPTSDIPYAAHVETQSLAKVKGVHSSPMHDAATLHTVTQTVNEWKISFCGCFDAPLHCGGAFFFPCLNAAYAAHHIGSSALLIGLAFTVMYWGSTTAFVLSVWQSSGNWFSFSSGYSSSESSVTTWNTINAACSIAFIVATCMLRRAVRSFDHIPGSTITDVCASIWCSCCVLSQLSAHTERVKPIRAANAATLPAYHAA